MSEVAGFSSVVCPQRSMQIEHGFDSETRDFGVFSTVTKGYLGIQGVSQPLASTEVLRKA